MPDNNREEQVIEKVEALVGAMDDCVVVPIKRGALPRGVDKLFKAHKELKEALNPKPSREEVADWLERNTEFETYMELPNGCTLNISESEKHYINHAIEYLRENKDG